MGGAGPVEELQRKTPVKDSKKDVVEVGTGASLRELARSLSTAALMRYAMAMQGHN